MHPEAVRLGEQTGVGLGSCNPLLRGVSPLAHSSWKVIGDSVEPHLCFVEVEMEMNVLLHVIAPLVAFSTLLGFLCKKCNVYERTWKPTLSFSTWNLNETPPTNFRLHTFEIKCRRSNRWDMRMCLWELGLGHGPVKAQTLWSWNFSKNLWVVPGTALGAAFSRPGRKNEAWKWVVLQAWRDFWKRIGTISSHLLGLWIRSLVKKAVKRFDVHDLGRISKGAVMQVDYWYVMVCARFGPSMKDAKVNVLQTAVHVAQPRAHGHSIVSLHPDLLRVNHYLDFGRNMSRCLEELGGCDVPDKSLVWAEETVLQLRSTKV